MRIAWPLLISVVAFVGCADCARPAIVGFGTPVPRQEQLEVVPIVAGEIVDLQFGSQKAWMLVPVIELVGAEAPPVAFMSLADDEGVVLSEVKRAPCAIERADDGRLYATGPFLQLASSNPVLRTFDWDGADATLDVRLEWECGEAVEASTRVRLELP